MKWVERIYSETDFAKSVATTIAGVVGLFIYLKYNDWVIAAFALIILFPLFRLIASHFHKKLDRKGKERLEEEKAERFYKKLSDVEKEVVLKFV